MYFDEDNHYFATLIENTDLLDIGINTEGYDYRIVEYLYLSQIFTYFNSIFYLSY